MRILIAGAGGMLAQALARVFVTEEVRALSQQDMDITNRGSILFQAKDFQPHIIINAAAYTNVDGAEQDREAAFAVNEHGVRNLAEVAKAVGAIVIHYSTDYVFPGDTDEGYREDDEPGPAVNVYGESKLAGERALASVGGRYYILRTAWLYGPNGKNFVDTMLQLGKTNAEVRVVNDQWGSPTYTKDVAQATLSIVNDQQLQPGIYHVVNQGVTSWFELAQTIFSLAQVPAQVIPISHTEYRAAARRPGISRLLVTRGPVLRAWQEALGEYITTKGV